MTNTLKADWMAYNDAVLAKHGQAFEIMTSAMKHIQPQMFPINEPSVENRDTAIRAYALLGRHMLAAFTPNN